MTIVIFQDWNLCSYLLAYMACHLKVKERAEFSKLSTSWKTILELTTGNVVISEVDAVVYVVLSKAEKHVPYGKLVCTKECVIRGVAQTVVVITEFNCTYN